MNENMNPSERDDVILGRKLIYVTTYKVSNSFISGKINYLCTWSRVEAGHYEYEAEFLLILTK